MIFRLSSMEEMPSGIAKGPYMFLNANPARPLRSQTRFHIREGYRDLKSKEHGSFTTFASVWVTYNRKPTKMYCFSILKLSTGYLKFIWDPIYTNELWYPMKIDVHDLKVQANFSYEVITTDYKSHSHDNF